VNPPVRAEVKNILIHGVGAASDASIGGFAPVDPEHFGVNVQVFIGTAGSDAFDSLMTTGPQRVA
jgi:hypothetical protein